MAKPTTPAQEWFDEIVEMRKPRHPSLKSAPLRLVVNKDTVVNVSPKPDEYEMKIVKWQLECGHLVSPPQDIYGERFPQRMRCGQCAQDI